MRAGGIDTASGRPNGTPLRVCILTETYHPIVGGGETQARLLAEGLLERGVRVSIVTRRVHRSHPRREKLDGVEIHRQPPTGARHLNKWGLLLTALPQLLRERRQYDVLFVSGFRILGVPAIAAAVLCGIPCVLKADSLGEMSGDFFAAGLGRLGLRPSSLLVRPLLWLRNRLLRRADAFVAICSPVREELLQHRVAENRIQAIPNSVDAGGFRPLDPAGRDALRRRLGIPFERQIVTYVGRLVSYKGLPLLTRAWNKLRQVHPQAGLLLVGSGGLDIHNCEDEIRSFVERHDLQKHVHFTGDVDNVHEFLQASDIFVLPTENDAFPLSIIEAMACGLPVVSTAVGGLKDIVEGGGNGLIVKPNDLSGLVEALDALLRDEQLCRRLGEAGRRTVEERYAAPTILRQYLELFESVARAAEG